MNLHLNRNSFGQIKIKREFSRQAHDFWKNTLKKFKEKL
jgi:hypothetical protein